MRHLGTIQKVESLSTISNADTLLKCKLLGKAWPIVVKKDDNYEVGDLVIYCEPDSVLPGIPIPMFESLWKSCYLPRMKGLRIRSIFLRGQLSQGIIFPLSLIDEIERWSPVSKPTIEFGNDITEYLGIRLYEEPVPMSKEAKGNFPSFIPHTDEERIENIPDIVNKYRNRSDIIFYVTEKVDGVSATFYVKDGEFGICSRGLELKPDADNEYTRVAKTYNIEENLRNLGYNIAIQGEIIGCTPKGKGIAGNKYGLPASTFDFFLFSAFNIDEQEYFGFQKLLEIADALNLKTVPILDQNYALPINAEGIMAFAHGKSQIADIDREGIVIRSIDERSDLEFHLRRLSFKSVDAKFLIKYKE
jgi:RNA ligase (TIGR02306 family)